MAVPSRKFNLFNAFFSYPAKNSIHDFHKIEREIWLKLKFHHHQNHRNGCILCAPYIYSMESVNITINYPCKCKKLSEYENVTDTYAVPQVLTLGKMW
jgi:hypothetical protein